MLISHPHAFIFIHVAKVAGTSIKHTLAPYVQEPEHFVIKRPLKTINGAANPMYQMWDSMIAHATAKQTRKQLPEQFQNYFSFAFVRHPWDWQVSMYHFLLKQPENPFYPDIVNAGSFRNYMDWIIAEDKPYPKGAPKKQITMLTDEDGKIIVDYIGRYENLCPDFSHVMRQVGLQGIGLPNLNHSKHSDYRQYYDSYTKKLVAKHYEEDIEAFKYTFD